MKVVPMVVGWLPRSWTDYVLRARWQYKWMQPIVTWAAGKFKNQEGRIAKGPAKGLIFNTGQSHASFLLGTSEEGVQSLIVELLGPGKFYYDVGANVGFFALLAARQVGSQGRVVCFEPVPANLDLLRHNIGLNKMDNVVVRSEALGASNGEARFFLSNQPTLGKLADAGKAPFDHSGETVVQVRRLDDLIEQGLAGPPDVIKIDVEGAEMDVLKGAANTFRDAGPYLILEVHGTNQEIAQALRDMGYFGRMLGEDSPIETAYWNGAVIACPANKPEMVANVERLSTISLGLK